MRCRPITATRRVRGRPLPRRGARTTSMTTVNVGESPSCPGPRTIASVDLTVTGVMDLDTRSGPGAAVGVVRRSSRSSCNSGSSPSGAGKVPPVAVGSVDSRVRRDLPANPVRLRPPRPQANPLDPAPGPVAKLPYHVSGPSSAAVRPHQAILMRTAFSDLMMATERAAPLPVRIRAATA